VPPLASPRPRRRATSGAVSERLRAMITSGELEPGARLPSERALAARFKVARGSLRTALRSLEGIGVVEARHGSGTYVASGPPRLPSGSLGLLAAVHRVDAHALYEARAVLEVAVAGLAAQHATGEQLSALRRELEQMQASIDDPAAYWRHDVAFHKRLGEASGNPILASLTELVADALYERERAAVTRAGDLPEATRLHQRIVVAVARRRPAAARTAMAEHLRRAEAAERARGSDT
jgi:GntR family transcriptional repressor for pyruvate dehydrogenase complex